MPIVEPEISINNSNKSIIEDILKGKLNDRLHHMQGKCILKLTLPDVPNIYLPLLNIHSVQRIVGLSGGYTTEQACIRLSLNKNMQASFSRALSEGLYYNDPDDYFETAISKNITEIVSASQEG